MPFILFNPLEKVRKLRSCFAAETGLPLQVYSRRNIAKDDSTLFDLQRDNYLSEYVYQQIKYSCRDYYLLNLQNRVSDFEEMVRYQYGLDIKIFTRNFKTPDKHDLLINLVSENHPAKKIYREQMLQLSQKYRVTENDIYERFETVNNSIYSIITEDNYYTDYNVSAKVSYYFYGNSNTNPEIHTHELFGMYHGERGNNNHRNLFPFRANGSSLMIDHLRNDLGLTDFDILRINRYSIEIHSECQRLHLYF